MAVSPTVGDVGTRRRLMPRRQHVAVAQRIDDTLTRLMPGNIETCLLADLLVLSQHEHHG
jgi:hypothetical protein